jgi:hypothetical protein
VLVALEVLRVEQRAPLGLILLCQALPLLVVVAVVGLLEFKTV